MVAAKLVTPLYANLISFSLPLKAMIVEVMSRLSGEHSSSMWRIINSDEKDTHIIPGIGVTPRYLMQTLGTNWGRQMIHPNLWVKIAEARAESIMKKGYSVVFDDMRFPNEHEFIKRAGGVAIKIIRPNHTGGDGSIGEGLLDRHPFDRTIINDGDLTALNGKVGALVREYLGPKADLAEYQ